MRLLGRLLILFVVLGLGAGGIAGLRPVIDTLTFGKEEAQPEEQASRSVVYPLGTERWTRFPFSNPPRHVRLLVNASVPPGATGDMNGAWRYAIEYQIVDATGAVLREDVLHLSTRLLAYIDPATQETMSGARYADHDALPTAADLVTLDLGQVPGAAALRARFVSGAPTADTAVVAGAAVRIYERRPVRESRLPAAWARLSPEDRTMLGRSSVFGAPLLTSEERAWLIRNNWLPIGPSGVGGVDFETRTLISLGGDQADARIPVSAGDAGFYLDASRRVTLQLPEDGGRIRFVVEAEAEALASSLDVVFHEPLAAQGIRRSYPLDGSMTRFEDVFGGGVLEVSAEAPLRLRAYLLKEGEEAEDLTVEVSRLRAYTLLPTDPLRYAVTTLEGEPTPFRLVLRCQCATEPDMEAEPAEVHYVISADDQAIIQEGTIRVAAAASPYDRLRERPGDPLSVPTEIYFNLPKEATAVSFVSDALVIVYGFTRPPGATRHFMIPEDKVAEDAADEGRRTWFYLRPEGWDVMSAGDRAPIVEVPARPPERDPEIAAGRYTWEQFVPVGDWLARELLIPADGDTEPRVEALGSSYVSLPLGEELRLDFASRNDAETVTPELVYLKPDAESASIGVRIDGEEVFSGLGTGTRGSMSLPALEIGERRVVVDSPADVSVFLSNVQGRPVALARRQAIRLPPGETIFEIEKRTDGEELLTARVFPSGDVGRQNLRVVLENPVRPLGPLAGWTLDDREYSIGTSANGRSVVVLGSDQMVGPERRFVVPLGADLPAGTYRLRMVLEDGPELYLALSRTTVEASAQRDGAQE
ncbi:hypothetical protein [Paracoccus sp. 228]|uniref:hypothetical protein n=2 Tax=Bacteria TaxID=2 RepID=UPI0005DE9917|nr:hypothetical protein [Paracoccus sp. 228]KIX18082.1 hypothetical protein SY26_06995 [Paracoccus sp. 228]